MSIQNVGKGRWTLFETVSERERPIQSSPRHAEASPTNRAASQPRYRERCGAVGEHMRRKNNLALTRFGEGGRGREREMEKERESDREGRGGRPAICERQFSPYFPIFWRLPPPFLSREARRRKGRGAINTLRGSRANQIRPRKAKHV